MLQHYCPSLTNYKRLITRGVKVGDLVLGNGHPIRIQTMTTTDTMDTDATVAQTIRCIEAGAELVRITAPSKKEAENLLPIKNKLRALGFNTPLVADIHFTPNAAELAARIVEKVRVNPGNYIDKKKFDFIEYTDVEYAAEIDRIRERFTPLLRICKEYGTAMRIGTNHGSLSDRIMSRYGDTPIGMVESAMEFLRIARDEQYHQIVLSMKSSNPQVMVQAYRLLVRQMDEEFGECYPLHLGVTEAGDGEDGRIKSAIGIGTLLEDGLGDTIRVSLTEDPELELPVCRNIVKRYEGLSAEMPVASLTEQEKLHLPYDPFNYQRRNSIVIDHIGGHHVPVVVADFMKSAPIKPEDLIAVGYRYDPITDKWSIGDRAADYLYTSDKAIDFALPGTLQVICDYPSWLTIPDKGKYHPLFKLNEYLTLNEKPSTKHFVVADANDKWPSLQMLMDKMRDNEFLTLCIESTNKYGMSSLRRLFIELLQQQIKNPVILRVDGGEGSADEQLVNHAINSGGLLLEGFGDGIWLWNQETSSAALELLNNTAFSILQATRTRISKTEYISCPSCGRTLFDLQETTARIRSATNHLKGIKIAIMGCIVNGPGEMADADFGYVGSGPGKITLYKGKEVVKRNVSSAIAVNELIQLLKDNEAWIEPAHV
jgi:(E)-4-hydroxy-3-methylbut-2-enyl-diphosphate synthase